MGLRLGVPEESGCVRNGVHPFSRKTGLRPTVAIPQVTTFKHALVTASLTAKVRRIFPDLSPVLIIPIIREPVQILLKLLEVEIS